MPHGYYRHPSVAGDQIVFTSEDDLWSVPAAGGVPRRITAGHAEATHGHLSPDGRWIAYTGRDEGHVEVYVMPAEGGASRRLTFMGGISLVTGWNMAPEAPAAPKGKKGAASAPAPGPSIIFASNTRQPFHRQTGLFEVPLEGGEPKNMGWGPARHLSRQPGGPGLVIGRNTHDAARWKRYKGGTAGALWVDRQGDGQFKLLELAAGNPTSPMWIGDRIYFLADHEGFGNLYSTKADGKDLRRHTDHETFYARQATSDGKRIVYHAGADIFLYDPKSDESHVVEIDWHSPAPQAGRKFTDASRFMDGHDLHPQGHSLVVTTRGKPFALSNWAGPVVQLGEPQGVRYRMAAWLPDGERVVAVHDAKGDEGLAIYRPDGAADPVLLGAMDLGRVVDRAVAPHGDHLAIVNHRNELIVVDLAKQAATILDKSEFGPIMGVAWSPDGAWVAYGMPVTGKTSAIKIAGVATGESHVVTKPVLMDVMPAWDPGGRYLYFLSHRCFDPVYDNLHFDLGFPKGTRPALITLRPDVPSPFVPSVPGPLVTVGRTPVPAPAAPSAEATPVATAAAPKARKKGKGATSDGAEGVAQVPPQAPPPPPVVIDFAGIERRVVAFPVPEGRYDSILAFANKVMFTSNQPEGALATEWLPGGPTAKSHLEIFDLDTQKRETVIDRMTAVWLSGDGTHMLVQIGDRLRVLAAGEKPKPDAPHEAGRESGWLDLGRIRVSVDPRAEWRQMYKEAWRLQRDQFWTADMSRIDWAKVHETYLPLLDRIATRAEFSDLLWEMQGELGTSHAYEWGGDYKPVPRYDQGLLGADFTWDEKAQGYRIGRIVQGDAGEPYRDSPLNRVGTDIQVGDVILAVGGQKLSATFTPSHALVHQANMEVQLTIAGRAKGDAPRTVGVRTVHHEFAARYREWVDGNRAVVHAATKGRVGYIHIPDMGPIGFAEFHRAFLVESMCDGLVVDVRNNGGGHVSQLLLEKLARRRLGYDVPRWAAITPYPDHSVAGPIVGITNEIAGSDGDIFSHCFKLMKLGPLLGKRTWGGVIGIWPRHGLVDGTYTTQPEYSFWFYDVGWGVENYGADPDIEVDNAPQDYLAGRDVQLAKAIAEANRLLAANPPRKPDFSKRPNLAAPILPPRKGPDAKRSGASKPAR